MSAVLVVSRADDGSADAVTAELLARDVPVYRMDLQDFPERVDLAASIAGSGEWVGTIAHRDGWAVALAELTAVYYRRPTDFDVGRAGSKGARRFVRAEARMGFGGVLASLDALFVNHPFRIADAEFKPAQLKTAAKCGLHVPTAIITNDGEAALAHAEDLSQVGRAGVVYKPMASGFVRNDHDELRQIFTTPVVISRQDGPHLAATAHLLQARVEKRVDVRVTTVGHEHFAVAIDSATVDGQIDWRADYGSLTYEPVDIPEDVSEALSRYLEAMGLIYGATDFSVDRDGRWWFLECNPNGQWGFVAHAAELPIAAALAGLLAGA